MTIKFKKALEDVGGWSYDSETKQLHLSPLSAQIFQVEDTATITYENFLNYFDEEEKDFVDFHIQKLIETREAFVLECTLKKDYGEKAIRLSGAITYLENNRFIISGIVRLYTKELDSQFRDLMINKILDELAIISVTNVKGEIIYANKKFCDVSGLSQKDVIGNNHRVLKSGLHPKEFYENLWETVLSGQSWSGEIINKNKSGDLFYSDAYIYPIFNYKNEIKEIISVRFETTEKKLREQDELVRAKFQMMGETSAQIMHDVTNPLAIIHMSIDMLDANLKRKREITPEMLRARVTSMKESSERIKNIFANMKDLLHSKQEADVMDLHECILKAINICSSKLSKYNVETIVNVEAGKWTVEMNFQHLLQVFINLINNSVDAIENQDDKWIHFQVKDSGTFYVISISDSGAGVEPSLHKKIFQPLFTTKDKDKGTGLGLPICKRIVENYGGRIILNEEATHTQFDIYLLKHLSNKMAS